ncbi:hypothetical protein [Lysinibacillus yapensis]|uniref:hypothetical protein n=1 Tax=Ureibacillus yapensis TaxID=2304605 RepID=UPI001314F8AE|nr:hypothetical protein [Lysinibacillus yapensis]
MDTKLKNKIEAGITTISVIASVAGMFVIIMKTWQFMREHLGEMIQLLVKLF